jgi:hypothetical protein
MRPPGMSFDIVLIKEIINTLVVIKKIRVTVSSIVLTFVTSV